MKKDEAKLVKIESIDTLYQDACQIIENARSNAVSFTGPTFYRTYPIANTVRSQLNWSQYRRLIQIEDPDKRDHLTLNC